jgi:hypothetical protein
MNSLPHLYTLVTVPVVGHLRDTIPDTIYCVTCGRPVHPWRNARLVIDVPFITEIFKSTDGTWFITDRLKNQLETLGARGYVTQEIPFEFSDDYYRWASIRNDRTQRQQPLYYLAITGLCDGPWVSHRRAGQCPTCGQAMAIVDDMETLITALLDDAPPPTRLVYPDTWHQEDLFYLSEPGPPLITERVAQLIVPHRPSPERVRPVHSTKAQHGHALTYADPHTIELYPARWVDRD